ncbi:Uncharacterised protein [Actinobacillus equuli]|nr:Uncharacterised protein [Actinobacillus equuli]
MEKCLYEYIAAFEFDDEPTKDDVLKIISEGSWDLFKCQKMLLGYVAQEILEEKYSDWEMYDEDESVYLIVRKYGDEEWELHKATIQYRLYVDTEEIYFDDEE